MIIFYFLDLKSPSENSQIYERYPDSRWFWMKLNILCLIFLTGDEKTLTGLWKNLYSNILLNFCWLALISEPKNEFRQQLWRQTERDLWGQSKFRQKNPSKCGPDFPLQWSFQVVYWSFLLLKREFRFLILKFPLQYSFIEISILVFDFWFSSSMTIQGSMTYIISLFTLLTFEIWY